MVPIPLQITFHQVDASRAVEARIREKVDKLTRFAQGIVECRVVVEAPHRQHRKGKLYQIRIEVTLPGTEIVVNRAPHDARDHENIYIAIRDAFDAVRRQLEDFSKRRQSEAKSQEKHSRMIDPAA